MGSKSRIALALAGAVLMAVPVAAQTELPPADFTYYNVCGVADGTSLRICASADLTLHGSTLKMRVWNMEIAGASGASSYYTEFGGWHTITSVGLQYMGNATPGSGNFAGARYIFGEGANDYRSLTAWRGVEDGGRNPIQVDIGSSTQGHREGIVGCRDPGNANAGHVATCNSYGFMPYVEFTFTDVTLPYDFASYYFEFHGQQMHQGRSAKGSGPGTPNTPPSEVVPEPLTMVLLGTGLAGIGGVSLRRRRRDEDDELDA